MKKQALISVSDKTGVVDFARELVALGYHILSTGGTAKLLTKEGVPCQEVADYTGFPEMLDGRVKTLNPKIHAGILARRPVAEHMAALEAHGIDPIDIICVNLYPFEQTVASGAEEQAIIEKIDIGGISLIRAAAKNFKDVVIVPSVDQYAELLEIITSQQCSTTLEQRRRFAAYAFNVSSHYDAAIFNYFNLQEQLSVFKRSFANGTVLRYGAVSYTHLRAHET